MAALEIVEHDELDATTGKAEIKDPSKDYHTALEKARDLKELGSIWQSIPKELQSRCLSVKDGMKEKLLEVAA